MRAIELLAPARDLECGLEAVRHGADAVYIGAARFGARAAAGNSVEDIATLVRYAHTFGVRIYVTLNTLLYDDELPAAQALIDQLAAIHVDALITQDPRILPPSSVSCPTDSSSGSILSPLPLHSSTQMDNRTVDDVRARLAAGYTQTVLARELSLDAIRSIHVAVPDMPLEVFVHGALCVSYSGRCYASEYCFGRSANRGECAQFCRLPFDLLDADGKPVPIPVTEGSSEGSSPNRLRQRHLLSLRDMNRAADLEALMDAGVTSFKIEGRLKDVAYVKNTTAYYRQRIDAILARRAADYCRSSYGTSTLTFTPDVNKSFNRRFTDYFLHSRTPDMACFATPKAIGEPVGTVSGLSPQTRPAGTLNSSDFLAPFKGGSGYFQVRPLQGISSTPTFSNGDGFCFFDADGHLQGFRINRVDEQGRFYPADPSILASLRKGTLLYRNFDAAFERLLARPSADRRIHVRWLLEEAARDLFRLTLITEDGRSCSREFPYPFELARTPQADNIRRQLARLGDTPYTTTDADITIALSDNWFIPSSILTNWRREIADPLSLTPSRDSLPALPVRERAVTYANESTLLSRIYDADACSEHSAPSLTGRAGGESLSSPLMTCRYCLRHALGFCPRDHAAAARTAPRLPWFLRLADGRTFPLRFDCQRCEMQVLSDS